MISNLYKIKWVEEESKYKKEKMMREVQQKSKKQLEDKEANMQEKSQKKYNSRCELLGRGRVFFFSKNRKKKHFEKRKEDVENKSMMWPLMWLNRSIATKSNTLQLLDKYK